LLQFALASADEALQFFQDGITTYNLGQKVRHLHIDPIYALACNCVSDQIAKHLAVNVCDMFRSDWGIGITGYSSAVSESGNKIFCFFAIAYRGEIVAENKLTSGNKDAFAVQINYVQEVLDTFLRHIQ
jgi:nicotinamide-nucleotide amidase